MPHLSTVKWSDFTNPSPTAWGSIASLRAIDGRGKDTELRVVTTLGQRKEVSSSDKVRFEEEIERLFLLHEANILAPKALGRGETELETPIVQPGVNPYTIYSEFPFYAREWTDRAQSLTKETLQKYGESLIDGAVQLGVQIENLGLSYFGGFGQLGNKCAVRPEGVGKFTEERHKEDLYDILWQFKSSYLPVFLKDIDDTSVIGSPILREAVEAIKSSKIKSFADLRKYVLAYVQELAENMKLYKDPVSGLYRPKSEVLYKGQEAFSGIWIQVGEGRAETTQDQPTDDRRQAPEQPVVTEPYTPLQRKQGNLQVNRRNRETILDIVNKMYNDFELQRAVFPWILETWITEIGYPIEDREFKDPSIQINYGRLWDNYEGFGPEIQKLIHPYLERLEGFVSEPSLLNRISEQYRFNLDISAITSGKYNPINWIRGHPSFATSLALGGAGLSISELWILPEMLNNPSIYARLGFDMSLAGLGMFMVYGSMSTTKFTSNSRKMLAALVPTACGLGLFGLIMTGVVPKYQETQGETVEAPAIAPAPVIQSTSTPTIQSESLPTVVPPTSAATAQSIAMPVDNYEACSGRFTGNGPVPGTTYRIEGFRYEQSGKDGYVTVCLSRNDSILPLYIWMSSDGRDRLFKSLKIGGELEVTGKHSSKGEVDGVTYLGYARERVMAK